MNAQIIPSDPKDAHEHLAFLSHNCFSVPNVPSFIPHTSYSMTSHTFWTKPKRFNIKGKGEGRGREGKEREGRGGDQSRKKRGGSQQLCLCCVGGWLHTEEYTYPQCQPKLQVQTGKAAERRHKASQHPNCRRKEWKNHTQTPPKVYWIKPLRPIWNEMKWKLRSVNNYRVALLPPDTYML